jgi:hypothetical protein
MSARSANTGPAAGPAMVATTPVRATGQAYATPIASSSARTRAPVRCSWKASSGCWCTRRRTPRCHSANSGARAASRSSRAGGSAAIAIDRERGTRGAEERGGVGAMAGAFGNVLVPPLFVSPWRRLRSGQKEGHPACRHHLQTVGGSRRATSLHGVRHPRGSRRRCHTRSFRSRAATSRRMLRGRRTRAAPAWGRRGTYAAGVVRGTAIFVY